MQLKYAFPAFSSSRVWDHRYKHTVCVYIYVWDIIVTIYTTTFTVALSHGSNCYVAGRLYFIQCHIHQHIKSVKILMKETKSIFLIASAATLLATAGICSTLSTFILSDHNYLPVAGVMMLGCDCDTLILVLFGKR